MTVYCNTIILDLCHSILHFRRKKQITKGGQYNLYIMQSGNFANHTIDIMGKNTSGSPKPTS